MLRSLVQAGGAHFGSKSETERLELGFGGANKNGGAGQWGGIVGWCVTGGGGGGTLCSLAKAGVAIFGLKSETELLELGFKRADGKCCAERWGRRLGSVYEVVVVVVVVVGRCVQQRKAAGGGWGQNHKPSYNSSVWGWVWAMSGYAGFCGLTVPPATET
jgi:hypothetical protein